MIMKNMHVRVKFVYGLKAARERGLILSQRDTSTISRSYSRENAVSIDTSLMRMRLPDMVGCVHVGLSATA